MEDLTIWEQAIKYIYIKGHCSIVLVEYMNQNRKIFELCEVCFHLAKFYTQNKSIYTLVNRYNYTQ
jgi:hypothetical protein